MYKFSKKSKEKLETAHPDLQRIYAELIKIMDVTILEGVRSKKRQEELVRTGMSKALDSKHLLQKDGYSHAVDAAPFPINWEDTERFAYMCGMIRGIAHMMNIKVRVGCDWDSDGNIKDHSFLDYPHTELIGQ